MNSIRFEITEKELDENSTVLTESEYTIQASYDVSNSQSISMQSGNVWKTYTFPFVTTVTAVKIISDEPLTIRLNGGTEEIDLEDSFVFTGNITGLQFKNNSGSTATILIETWGEE